MTADGAGAAAVQNRAGEQSGNARGRWRLAPAQSGSRHTLPQSQQRRRQKVIESNSGAPAAGNQTAAKVDEQKVEGHSLRQVMDGHSGFFQHCIPEIEHGQHRHLMSIANEVVQGPAFLDGKSGTVSIGQVEGLDQLPQAVELRRHEAV